MKRVGLKALKNKLREYLRLASSGETVIVTDKGHVLAEIVAPRGRWSPLLRDTQLAEAVKKGWLTLPASISEDPPPRKPVASLRQILTDLGKDRAER